MDRVFAIVWISAATAAGIGLAVSFICFSICMLRGPTLDLSDEKATKGTMFESVTPIVQRALQWVRTHDFEPVCIQSRDGLSLAGKFLQAGGGTAEGSGQKSEDSCKTVILVHGYRSVAENDFAAVLQPYHEAGFHILLIDQRCHGKSEGRYITYGIKESEDLLQWIAWVANKFPGRPIFLSGISMGAATILMAARFSLPPEVKGMMADCGFTSPEAVIRHTIQHTLHLPSGPFYAMINVWSKLLAKCDLSAVSTLDAMQTNRIPVLFVHGKADSRVPCQMTEKNYAACQAYKEMALVDGAEHGCSILKEPERVTALLKLFIENCLRQTNREDAESPVGADT